MPRKGKEGSYKMIDGAVASIIVIVTAVTRTAPFAFSFVFMYTTGVVYSRTFSFSFF